VRVGVATRPRRAGHRRPAAAATAPSCRVKNPTQDTWFATQDGRALTRAIAAADPGDRLNVFGTVNTLTLNSTVVSGNVPDDCAC
jgi:hypothetical protein